VKCLDSALNAQGSRAFIDTFIVSNYCSYTPPVPTFPDFTDNFNIVSQEI
jgi:hypothetical protein